jgi:hypothetical protein
MMRDDIRAKIASHIKSHGQHVVCVGRTPGDPVDFLPFAYTIGNHKAGLPELLLIRESGEFVVRILNILGELQRERGSGFRHGELVDFTARLPCRVVDAGSTGRTEYAVQAGVYYRTESFEVRQILLPDREGRYPGDPGCEPPYSEQPVLTATH